MKAKGHKERMCGNPKPFHRTPPLQQCRGLNASQPSAACPGRHSGPRTVTAPPTKRCLDLQLRHASIPSTSQLLPGSSPSPHLPVPRPSARELLMLYQRQVAWGQTCLSAGISAPGLHGPRSPVSMATQHDVPGPDTVQSEGRASLPRQVHCQRNPGSSLKAMKRRR